MSLELAITENTNAIRDLIVAIGNGLHATTEQVAAVIKEAKPTKSVKATVTTNGASNTPQSSPATSAADVAAPETASAAETLAATEAASVTQMAAHQAEAATLGAANRPADAPTYQDAAAAITKLSRTKGRDAAVAVLASFGAAKLPDVKPEQFAAIIAAAETAGA